MKAGGNFDPRRMRSPIRKRSIDLHGQKTSISLEDEFWSAFREIAAARKEPVSSLIVGVDRERSQGANLSSAIRLFVLRHYRPHGVSGLRFSKAAKLTRSRRELFKSLRCEPAQVGRQS